MMFHHVSQLIFGEIPEENIAWGHPTATHAEVQAAAEVGFR